MTVGELKEFIKNLSDDMHVVIGEDECYGVRGIEVSTMYLPDYQEHTDPASIAYYEDPDDEAEEKEITCLQIYAY